MNGIGILWNVCDGSFGVRGCGRPSLGRDAAVCAELFFAVLLFRLLLLLFFFVPGFVSLLLLVFVLLATCYLILVLL
jgi:hypothetical protein